MTLNEFLQDALSVVPPVLEAAVIGIAFSLHPKRLKRLRQTKKGRELLKGQVMITVAGALMVEVIGTGTSSTARAFGLLGLGSFIRFRTNIKSPADTAIFFLLIGLGMACAVGRPGAAAFGAVFLLVLVSALERFSPGPKDPSAEETDDDD